MKNANSIKAIGFKTPTSRVFDITIGGEAATKLFDINLEASPLSTLSRLKMIVDKEIARRHVEIDRNHRHLVSTARKVLEMVEQIPEEIDPDAGAITDLKLALRSSTSAMAPLPTFFMSQK
jgi:hypothetical protein